mgnify:CR=1 FL=1
MVITACSSNESPLNDNITEEFSNAPDTTYLNGDTIKLTFQEDVKGINKNHELVTVGKVPYECFYKKGEEFFFKTISYDTSGNVNIITNMDAEGNGKSIGFYENGQIKSEALFINGEMIDDSTIQYPEPHDSAGVENAP